jgi:beta-lactamase regulating signal transducer with metallopeptidase domain/HEAT repeat protein
MTANLFSTLSGGLTTANMSMVMLLAKATIILLLALGITVVMQRASAGARHLVWLVTVAALLFVPALTAWSPLPLGFLPPVRTVAHNSPSVGAPALGRSDGELESGIPPASSQTASPSSRINFGIAQSDLMNGVSILFLIWAAVVLLIAGSLVYAALTVRRIVNRARPLDSEDWRTPLWEVSDRLGLNEPPRLLRSEDAKMPFACGFLRATIVLPAECDAWSLDRRRAVLLHELAHVRRHDLVGHTLGRLACAVYWFHPLVWTAAKQLRSESERACDDLALACGARATDYAEHLLDIVTSVRRDSIPSVALAMARRKEFEGRMLAILDPELRHSSPSRRQSATLIGSLAIISIVVGAAAPTPRVTTEITNTAAPANSASTLQMLPKPAAKGYAEHSSTALKSPSVVVTAPSDERPALLAKILATDTSASLRRIAAWGLAEYADNQVASQALANALRRDSDVRVREMAAWALAEGTNFAPAIDALTTALRGDADPRVRARSAWALGSIGDRSSVDALVAALSDPNVEVRKRAAWAIGSSEPRQAPRALIALLTDRDPGMRELAAWALYQIEDPAAIPALETALRAETSKNLQIDYIRALAATGEKSVDALKSLLESSDPEIKSIAVRALAGGHATGPWPWPWPEPRPYPE